MKPGVMVAWVILVIVLIGSAWLGFRVWKEFQAYKLPSETVDNLAEDVDSLRREVVSVKAGEFLRNLKWVSFWVSVCSAASFMFYQWLRYRQKVGLRRMSLKQFEKAGVAFVEEKYGPVFRFIPGRPQRRPGQLRVLVGQAFLSPTVSGREPPPSMIVHLFCQDDTFENVVPLGPGYSIRQAFEWWEERERGGFSPQKPDEALKFGDYHEQRDIQKDVRSTLDEIGLGDAND